MIFHTPIMAMLLASAISVAVMVWAAWFAFQVVRKWDVGSGHARQLVMERRTYLVSTALVFVMVLELASLMLFVFNADKMAVMFVGAMCAVGTFNMNEYGMPALMLKVAVFFGASVWLLINHADGKGRDYPLTKFKYGYLLFLAPLVAGAAGTQLAYFLNLNADVITSCCSKLFMPETTGIEAQMSAAPPGLALGLLFGGLAAMLILAAVLKGRGRVIYGIAAAGFFVMALVAVISVISSYIYEQPHHHCPFCILKPEYDYIGYLLYLPLFAGLSFALASSLLSALPLPDSLRNSLPSMIRLSTMASAALFAMFGLLSLWIIWQSNLLLFY